MKTAHISNPDTALNSLHKYNYTCLFVAMYRELMKKNPSKWYYADTKSFFSLVAKATLRLKFLIVKFRGKKKKDLGLDFFFFFASVADRSFMS